MTAILNGQDAHVHSASGMSLGTWFGELAAGTHVTLIGHGQEYIWSGQFAHHSGTGERQYALLVNVADGNVNPVEQLDRTDTRYAVVLTTGDGGRKTCGELTSNVMRTSVRQWLANREHHTYRGKVDADMELLSERLNREAKDRDWCSTYDSICEDLNGTMSVLQITPRKRAFEVEVDVTLSWRVTVRVDEAANEDDASDQVGDMDWDDILRAGGERTDIPDDHTIEVIDTREAS